MRARRAAAWISACWLLAGCEGAPPPRPPFSARAVVELARWQVWSGGEVIGYVRHLEIRDPQGPLPFYRIEDLHGRWLGHASEQGRFSRRVPFQDTEEDLGVWAMARGVALLVDAEAPVQLRPVAVEAAARRER
jgi:hypothetical protein